MFLIEFHSHKTSYVDEYPNIICKKESREEQKKEYENENLQLVSSSADDDVERKQYKNWEIANLFTLVVQKENNAYKIIIVKLF